ncbi:MAG: hypothetical protein M5R36_14690 [Deltaproteobacteria bacterium]|nr:hypothetical protein [Deltaproteobacteria bacterium]
MTAGVWIAPFLVDERSALVSEYPHWYVKDGEGKLVYFSDPIAGKRYRLLDVTVPGAAEYVREAIRTKVDEGFDYLKLDFLFGAAFEGVRWDGSTAMQAYHRAMRIVRDAAGEETFLLASGQPWLPTLGYVHAARDSSDITGSVPGFPLFTTTAGLARYHGVRAAFDGVWWHNDPDNLVVRPPLTGTQAEVAVASTYLAGRTLLGDSLVELEPERIRLLLQEGAEILRLAEGQFYAPDLMDEAVSWPIASPVSDVLGFANAAPRIWVRSTGEEAIVALFSWDLFSSALNFKYADLGLGGEPSGVTIEHVFGADTSLQTSGDVYTALVPGQSVAVYRFSPP